MRNIGLAEGVENKCSIHVIIISQRLSVYVTKDDEKIIAYWF